MNTQPTHIDNLNKVMGENYFNYRGKLVMKLIGGYRWNNKDFNSKEELDQAIDDAEMALEKSIQ